MLIWEYPHPEQAGAAEAPEAASVIATRAPTVTVAAAGHRRLPWPRGWLGTRGGRLNDGRRVTDSLRFLRVRAASPRMGTGHRNASSGREWFRLRARNLQPRQ